MKLAPTSSLDHLRLFLFQSFFNSYFLDQTTDSAEGAAGRRTGKTSVSISAQYSSSLQMEHESLLHPLSAQDVHSEQRNCITRFADQCAERGISRSYRRTVWNQVRWTIPTYKQMSVRLRNIGNPRSQFHSAIANCQCGKMPLIPGLSCTLMRK